MTLLHNSKSANIFNFLAMNRVITQISRSVRKEPKKNKALYLSNKAFVAFFEQLNERGVQYIVIGNLAVAFHGVIMTSKHIEIWVNVEEKNLKKMEGILPENVKPDSKGITIKTQSLGEQFELKVHLNLEYFPSGKFSWCYVKTETSVVSGVSIPVLSLDDLIVEKTASKKQEDLDIVEALENMSW